MSNLPLRALVMGAVTLLMGCVSPRAIVQGDEDMMSAAGFVPRPANTPERQASLARLPPNQIVQQFHGDTPAYIYADPLNCRCLYVGDQASWSRFQQQVQQQRLVNQQILAAQINASAWDWGPWGFGPGFY